MDISSLKDQLSDQFKELKDRIQESSLYVELKERFDLLPGRVQKLIVIGSTLFVGFFLFSIPYGNLSDSWFYEEQFEESRDMIRELLRASNTLKETSPLPTTSNAGLLESQIRRVLEDMNLGPEQVGNVQIVPNPSTRLAPKTVDQAAVSVQLKTLNLRQLTEFSHRLQNLGPGVKPVGMQISRSRGETHFFDVIVKVFQFSLNVGGEK